MSAVTVSAGPPACWAIYERDSRRIVSFQWVAGQPALSAHPELAAWPLPDGPPPLRPGGYRLEEDGHLSPA